MVTVRAPLALHVHPSVIRQLAARKSTRRAEAVVHPLADVVQADVARRTIIPTWRRARLAYRPVWGREVSRLMPTVRRKDGQATRRPVGIYEGEEPPPFTVQLPSKITREKQARHTFPPKLFFITVWCSRRDTHLHISSARNFLFSISSLLGPSRKSNYTGLRLMRSQHTFSSSTAFSAGAFFSRLGQRQGRRFRTLPFRYPHQLFTFKTVVDAPTVVSARITVLTHHRAHVDGLSIDYHHQGGFSSSRHPFSFRFLPLHLANDL